MTVTRKGQEHPKLLWDTPLLMELVQHSKPGFSKEGVARMLLWQHMAQCQAARQQMSQLQPSKQPSSLLVWRACNKLFQQPDLRQAAMLPMQRMLWTR